MFKIAQSAEYTWPVTVEVPTDGGRSDKATFDARFKRLTQTRMDEIRKGISNAEINDADLAREVLVGWTGVVDDSGEVPYSEAARDRLLDIPMVSAAVVMALLGSLSGARRKN
jgi:hypothetical protein